VKPFGQQAVWQELWDQVSYPVVLHP
jgi:hypothetical protein